MEEADRVLNLALKLHEPLAEMVSMQDITRYIKDPDTKDLIIHYLNDGLEKMQFMEETLDKTVSLNRPLTESQSVKYSQVKIRYQVIHHKIEGLIGAANQE